MLGIIIGTIPMLSLSLLVLLFLPNIGYSIGSFSTILVSCLKCQLKLGVIYKFKIYNELNNFWGAENQKLFNSL